MRSFPYGPLPANFILGDLFDRLRLQLPDPIVNWLTPVWILCVGAAAGLVLTAVFWGILWFVSRIPGVSDAAEKPGTRWVAIGVLTAVLFSVFATAYLRSERRSSRRGKRAQTRPPTGRCTGRRPASRSDLGARCGCLVAAGFLATAIVFLSGQKALAETDIALREGVLWPLFITALVMAGCAVFGLFIVRKPAELLDSLARWPVIMQRQRSFSTDAAGAARCIRRS